EMAGYFADPKIAFAQSPQNYMDWEDDGYLRSLFYSYRYFFDVSMPSRAHRDAIIFAGTMGLIRRSAMEEVGPWTQDCVTEGTADPLFPRLRPVVRGVADACLHGHAGPDRRLPGLPPPAARPPAGRRGGDRAPALPLHRPAAGLLGTSPDDRLRLARRPRRP